MDKCALITGATRGIGKQIAITLAKQGYNIALNYRKENEELENTKKEIEEIGVQVLAVKGDVANFENCENFVKQVIERFGQIDVLVNNAGITKDMLLMRMKKEDFEQVIDTNLVGTFNVTKNVISYMMKARSGNIVNISSVVGISGNFGNFRAVGQRRLCLFAGGAAVRLHGYDRPGAKERGICAAPGVGGEGDHPRFAEYALLPAGRPGVAGVYGVWEPYGMRGERPDRRKI